MEKISNNDKSQVLIDALPYIQKYNNKILVIKYGGNAMTNKELKDAVMTDIVLLSLVGVKVVLVHGGGPEISDMLKKLNIESRFVNGLRYTDDATVDVVKMVLSGKVNKVSGCFPKWLHHSTVLFAKPVLYEGFNFSMSLSTLVILLF